MGIGKSVVHRRQCGIVHQRGGKRHQRVGRGQGRNGQNQVPGGIIDRPGAGKTCALRAVGPIILQPLHISVGDTKLRALCVVRVGAGAKHGGTGKCCTGCRSHCQTVVLPAVPFFHDRGNVPAGVLEHIIVVIAVVFLVAVQLLKIGIVLSRDSLRIGGCCDLAPVQCGIPIGRHIVYGNIPLHICCCIAGGGEGCVGNIRGFRKRRKGIQLPIASPCAADIQGCRIGRGGSACRHINIGDRGGA